MTGAIKRALAIGAGIGLAVLLGLLIAGCEDTGPTAIGKIRCIDSLSCTPVGGLAGVYVCNVSPEGDWTFNLNGRDVSVEFGQLVFARSGDLVQACRNGCGCTHVQTLR